MLIKPPLSRACFQVLKIRVPNISPAFRELWVWWRQQSVRDRVHLGGLKGLGWGSCPRLAEQRP